MTASLYTRQRYVFGLVEIPRLIRVGYCEPTAGLGSCHIQTGVGEPRLGVHGARWNTPHLHNI